MLLTKDKWIIVGHTLQSCIVTINSQSVLERISSFSQQQHKQHYGENPKQCITTVMQQSSSSQPFITSSSRVLLHTAGLAALLLLSYPSPDKTQARDPWPRQILKTCRSSCLGLRRQTGSSSALGLGGTPNWVRTQSQRHVDWRPSVKSHQTEEQSLHFSSLCSLHRVSGHFWG